VCGDILSRGYAIERFGALFVQAGGKEAEAWAAASVEAYVIRHTQYALSCEQYVGNTYHMLTACADHVRTFEFPGLLHHRIMLFRRAQLAAASGDAPRSLPDHFLADSQPRENTQRMRMQYRPYCVFYAYVRQNGAYASSLPPAAHAAAGKVCFFFSRCV
jgi:hypothetical protein